MISFDHGKFLGRTILVVAILVSSVGLLILPGVLAFYSASSTNALLTILPSTTFVAPPPAGATGPDDITRLAIPGVDHGRALIWTAYQNGIDPNGTAGKTGGPTQSTVAGYDPITGALIKTISVTGKVDGLTADLKTGKLIATVNEDNNSAFNVISPKTGTITTFKYSPSPAVSNVGGTDSIAIRNGQIYIAHSNPSDTTQATDYLVTLDHATLTAKLTPVFFDDSNARDVLSKTKVVLGLIDPDTNYFMPLSSPRYAGDLATISQGDGKIIFASHIASTPRLFVLSLTDNKVGNIPPIDGIAVATSSQGILYVVDAAAGTIQALSTTGLPKGTVFVSEPSDNSNPLVGTLNLTTGVITPLGNVFVSPKGLLFVPTS
jgi:hypothetical protein